MTPDKAIQCLQRQIDAQGDVTDQDIDGWRHRTIGIVERIFGGESQQARTFRHAKATRWLSKTQQATRGILFDRRDILNTDRLRSVLLAFIDEIREFGLPATEDRNDVTPHAENAVLQYLKTEYLRNPSQRPAKVCPEIEAIMERFGLSKSQCYELAARLESLGLVEWVAKEAKGEFLRIQPSIMQVDQIVPIQDSDTQQRNPLFVSRKSTGGSEMYRRVGVMVGSPGDAADERQAITDAILRWNAAHSQEKGIMLEPVKWETHATPGLQGRPQGMINEELIPKSDCLIAVFRTRAGSPTGKEISGTIEEITEFMQQGKYVAIYFYEGEAAVSAIDPDQLKAVNDFKREIQQRGLTGSYRTVDELLVNLAHHLTAIVQTVTTQSPSPHGQPAAAPSANPLPLKAPLNSSPDAATEEESEIVVNNSGPWALLDTQFYETEAVRQTGDGDWVVEIRSGSAEDDAHLGGLQPQRYGRSRPIPFAHRNDGFLVTVKSVESVSQGGEQIWTVTLTPEDIDYGGSFMEITLQTGDKTYTPDDFARLRAGRILLNTPPPLQEDNRPVSTDEMDDLILESHIQGTNNPVSVEHCMIRVIHSSVGDDPERFLRLARLASIYFLKAGGAVERVLDLALGPIKQGHVHVRFRGRRRQVASNVEPTVIEVEGDCPLEE